MYIYLIFFVDAKIWLQPSIQGDVPEARGVHTAVVVGDNLVLFGGSGNFNSESMQCNSYYNDVHTIKTGKDGDVMNYYIDQGLSQDLETGWPKLASVKYWGILFIKGDHNILRLQPKICTGELGYDGPLYDGFLHMTDDMLGPSPMHIKYSSYVYDRFCI